MNLRLLLDVYYKGEFRGQCLLKTTQKDWDEIAAGIRTCKPGSWRAYADVVAAADIDSHSSEEIGKITARIAQIIPIDLAQ